MKFKSSNVAGTQPEENSIYRLDMEIDRRLAMADAYGKAKIIMSPHEADYIEFLFNAVKNKSYKGHEIVIGKE